jgi:hypothetical protein
MIPLDRKDGSRMRKRSRIAVAGTIGLVVVLGASIALSAARTRGGALVSDGPRGPVTYVKGSCKAGTKIHYVEETFGFLTTSSTTYIDVPNARLRFRVGGSGPSCVIVRFSAEAYSDLDFLLVQAVMGAQVAQPGTDVQLAGDDDTVAGSHAIEFIFPSVAPGRRTVKIQFRSGFGDPVWIHQFSMVIEHA